GTVGCQSGAPYSLPPLCVPVAPVPVVEPGSCATAGDVATAMAASATTMIHVRRAYPRKRLHLSRGPAGLADGLAQKEPALPAESPRDSPQRTWVPRSPVLPGIRLVARQH